MKNIKIEDTDKLNIELGDYKQIIIKAAERSTKILKKTSPNGKRKKRKYRNGWRYTKDTSSRLGFSSTVYNKTNYQLTHLLEHGHFIVNKKDGVGWAESKPHIEKAYEQAKVEFENEMGKVGVKVKK